MSDPADWDALVEEVREAADMRVVVSSESLSNADAPDIERLRDDLGADRVHVVRMVRRYDRLAPSQWQQQLHNGRRMSLARFCAKLFEPDSPFWRRHGFATLTRRWADVVGPANVSVVVVDENDPRWLLDVFERMLSLRDGTLPLPTGRPNRSLSMAEAETLRQVNAGIAKHAWSDRVIHHYVREGVSVGFKRLATDPESGKASLPRALHEQLREMTAQHIEELLALGVRVVGDVDLLSVPPWQDVSPSDDVASTPVTLSAAAVASAALDVVRMAENPVPLSGTPAPPADDRPRRSLFARRTTAHLTSPGPAGAFARHAPGTRLADAEHGRARHVLLTVVPPWQVLAGRWQAHLFERGEVPYADWLAAHPDAWDLPDLLAEAVDLVGPRGVVVAPADARSPSAWAEATSDLRGGGPPARVERSLLTWVEAEWVREFNVGSSARGVPEERWRHHLLVGAVPWALARELDTDSDNSDHPLEGELLARAEALGQQLRAAIERSGVDVVGDLDLLTRLRPAPGPARLAPRPASWPILGIIASSDRSS